MSLVELLLAAEAAKEDRAVRRTAYRHRYLSGATFVVAAFNLSGEAAAPLGFCYGTNPRKPKVVTAAEPRNRESRFKAINEFSADLTAFIAPYLALNEIDAGRGQNRYRLKVTDDAPQIVVPNSATQDYLGARLGRSLRYLGLGDTHEVPEETQWAGAHLSWLAEHTHLPGQSVFVSATELLGHHFVAGQSALENENLASFLAWIDNEPGSGTAAMDGAEEAAFGPVPDPNWEAGLEPLVRAFTEATRAGNDKRIRSVEKKVHERVKAELVPAYDATWRALAVMQGIPEASSVNRRWQNDIREWSGHARRCEHRIPRFARRHDAIRAAKKLEIWSSALEHLEADEAFDDPLVMANLDADGVCISGSVITADTANQEIKPGNTRASLVPLLDVRLDAPTRLLPGAEVVLTGDRRVEAEVRTIAEGTVGLALLAGHDRGNRTPPVGGTVLFASLNPFGGTAPADPEDVPWTHKPREEAATTTSDVRQEETPAESLSSRPDDSPDLTADELVELPAAEEDRA